MQPLNKKFKQTEEILTLTLYLSPNEGASGWGQVGDSGERRARAELQYGGNLFENLSGNLFEILACIFFSSYNCLSNINLSKFVKWRVFARLKKSIWRTQL